MKPHVSGIAALVALSVAGIAQTARADGPAQSMPKQGHLTIASDANISLTHAFVTGQGNNDTTTLAITPAADYFVVDNVSVGGFIPFSYTSGDNFSSTTIGIGARAGYFYPFSEQFGIWPRGGLSYASTSVSTTVTVNGMSVSNSQSAGHLALTAYVPFVFAPANHFFLGLGPEVSSQVTGDDPKVTTLGLSFMVGGWFLGQD
jgi:hypothetical protein